MTDVQGRYRHVRRRIVARVATGCDMAKGSKKDYILLLI